MSAIRQLLLLCMDPKKKAAELATFGKTHAKANAMAVALRSPGNSAEMKANQQIKVDLYVICRAKREILSEHFPKNKCRKNKKVSKALMPSGKFMSFGLHQFGKTLKLCQGQVCDQYFVVKCNS